MVEFRKIFCLLVAVCMAVSVVPADAAGFETEDWQEWEQEEAFTESEETFPEPAEEPTAFEEAVLEPTEETVEAEVMETEAAETEPEPEVEFVEETEPEEKPVWEQVPLYFQTDYPNTMYGTGTIATSGCTITALAMVATYMTGHEYLPDELARYFGGTAENNLVRMENGSRAMRLPFYKSANIHETMQALRDGKVAIALMTGNSLFSMFQHCIVLTGINDEGKIMVNDPYAPNYEAWNLKRAFQEGFTENDILLGYDGAWIYDKSAMPEEPFLYSEPEPVRGEPRYPDIDLSLAERKLLAKVMWVEARGESLEGQQAVAEVILNRMVSEDFPNTLEEVIYAEGQFHSVPFLEKAEPYQAQYEMIENALYGPYVLPENVYYFSTSPTNKNVWGKIDRHFFCYADS